MLSSCMRADFHFTYCHILISADVLMIQPNIQRQQQTLRGVVTVMSALAHLLQTLLRPVFSPTDLHPFLPTYYLLDTF